MVALLLILCLLCIVALVALVLGVVGVVAAGVSAIALLNAAAVTLGAIYGRRSPRPETWAPEATPAVAETLRELIVTEPIVMDDQSFRIETISH